MTLSQDKKVVDTKEPAVASLVSAYKPKKFEAQLQGITFNKHGDLLLTTSSLTSRYWTSSLFYYTADVVSKTPAGDATAAITADTALTGSELEDGVGDVLFFGPEDKDLLVGLDNGALEHLRVAPADPDTPFVILERLNAIHEQDGPTRRLTRSRDGDRIACASSDGSIHVLAADTLAAKVEMRNAHLDVVWDVAAGENGIWATAAEDGLVALWDERKEEGKYFVSKIPLTNSPPRALSFVPGNDNLLVVGQQSGMISLFDIRKPEAALNTHLTSEDNYPVTRICFSPKRSTQFAVMTDSCTLRQFTVEDSSSFSEVTSEGPTHKDFVKGAAWNPTDDKLWSCGWDKKIIVR